MELPVKVCPKCTHTWIPRKGDSRCPRCKTPTDPVPIPITSCPNCLYTWIPRRDKVVRCPFCKAWLVEKVPV